MNIYDQVTANLIEQLEQGQAPWVKPWKVGTGCASMPHNAISGRNYTGINVLIIWMMEATQNYMAKGWLTYNQVQSIEGNVKKGQKATRIVFYKKVEKKEGDDYFMAKGYNLFNIEQCENYDESKLKVFETIEDLDETSADEFAEALNAKVYTGGDFACYRPSEDCIHMPHLSEFKTSSDYEATLYHELTHWTKPKHRADREKLEYAFEELVAEIGASFLCAQRGVLYEKLQHTNYISYWLKALNNDNRYIFRASAMAQKACDWMLNEVKQEVLEKVA